MFLFADLGSILKRKKAPVILGTWHVEDNCDGFHPNSDASNLIAMASNLQLKFLSGLLREQLAIKLPSSYFKSSKMITLPRRHHAPAIVKP